METRMNVVRFLLLVMCLSFGVSSLQAQTTAVVGATLIDGTGASPLPNAVILIDGKKISAIGKRGEVKIPLQARVIDATGKYVIPGLIDTNVHLVMLGGSAWWVKYEGRYEDIAAEFAQQTLKNGVTTIYDSWGPTQPLLNVRDRIRRGELLASRLYVAGHIIGFSGLLGRDWKREDTSPFGKRVNKMWEENVGPELLDMTPDEVRTEMRKYIARGVDFIKFAASAHDTINHQLMFSPEAMKAIVEEGHKAGITVQTHTMNIESLRLAVVAGIDMGQHPELVGVRELPDDLIKMIVERRVYCGVLAIKKDHLKAGKWPALWHPSQGNIEKLIRAGAPITLATDARARDCEFSTCQGPALDEDDPFGFAGAHFLWLEAMIEKGMSPMDAIVSATRNGAAAYHHLSEFGTLEAGKYADLLVLDANPLENISNVRKISLVMKEGAVIDRDRLPEKKILTR